MAADRALPERFRLATFDIDGTLTTTHGWWVIAKAVHREEAYRESNRRFFSGEIGEDEHLGNLLSLAAGLRREEVEALLQATPKVADIGPALAELRSVGILPVLLSHNPEYVCDWYRRTFGFDHAEGTNGTRFGADGRLEAPRRVHADKPGGLARLLGRYQVAPEAVVHVGDGWADAILFPIVGGGVAFNTRLPEVARAADVEVRSGSLRDVARAIRRLHPRPAVNGARAADETLNT